MTVEIIAVGTELLMGQTANTNAQYLSSRLPDIGANVYHHAVVGDNMERIKAALALALSRADFVVMTGGLGPTMDDITKEAAAELLGLRMTFHEPSLIHIKDRMARHGHRTMAKSNERQAWFPEGAQILPNENGTAPGCVVESGGKAVAMLPGPPSEMRPMFDGQVMPYLARYSKWRLESRFVRVFGIGESALEDKLRDLVEGQTNPTLATYAKEGEVSVRVTARYPAGGGGRHDVVTPVVEEIARRLGHCVYSTADRELAEVALKAAASRKLTLAFSESCTGGLASAKITAIPGASQVLLMSAVAYSDEAKRTLLGVRADTLRAHGAVSREVAEEMALGARRVSGSDIAVSITGVAGPDGGSEAKPVGLVYVALACAATSATALAAANAAAGAGAGSGVGSGKIAGVGSGAGSGKIAGAGSGAGSGKIVGAGSGTVAGVATSAASIAVINATVGAVQGGARALVKELRLVGTRERVRSIACLHAFDMVRRAALGLPWLE